MITAIILSLTVIAIIFCFVILFKSLKLDNKNHNLMVQITEGQERNTKITIELENKKNELKYLIKKSELEKICMN